MEFVVLDFENDKPTTEIALAMLEIEVERMKKFGGKIIKVVHGYGSHGKGGEIRKIIHKSLTIWITSHRFRYTTKHSLITL